MGKSVAVSFEGNEVKIVHALQRGGNIKIRETEIIAVEEFDGYLKRSKDKDFIVTFDFKESYHDVLSVPLLKAGYLVKIIETEIRKTTGRKGFTFLYLPIGDRVINNRKMLDVFYFMATDETIRDVVDMFYNRGKTVKALYPPVFAAASLLKPGAPGEADMGVIYTGNERTIFSTKNGAVNFIRNYDPHEAGFSDFDIENINMTINYCRQNLRTSPLSVKLLGDFGEFTAAGAQTVAPLAVLYKAPNIQCSREAFDKFFLSIASLYAGKPANILSSEFKNISALRSFTVYASRAFILLAVLCLGFIFFEAKDAYTGMKRTVPALSIRSDVEAVYADYLKREETLNNITPLIDFLNRPSTEIRELLLDLADIDAQYLRFDSIDAKAGNGAGYMVSINGTGLVDTYSSFQASFNKMVRELERIKNVAIEHKTINLMDKTFKIKFLYKKQDALL